MERDCCEFIYGAPTTFSGYRIEQIEKPVQVVSQIFKQLRFLQLDTAQTFRSRCNNKKRDLNYPVSLKRVVIKNVFFFFSRIAKKYDGVGKQTVYSTRESVQKIIQFEIQ